MNLHVYDDYLTITSAEGEFTFSYSVQVAGAPIPPDILRQAYDQSALFEAARQHLPADVDILIDSLREYNIE